MTNNIHEQIQEELQHAREVCNTAGATAGECAAAWDAVEELQAEASHQRAGSDDNKTSLQQYCDDNPEAAECRIYDD
jgi:hypothetical protein